MFQLIELPDPSHLAPFLAACGARVVATVAALHEGRRCLIIEKDPGYCDIIRRRIADAQGVGTGSFLVQPGLFDGEG